MVSCFDSQSQQFLTIRLCVNDQGADTRVQEIAAVCQADGVTHKGVRALWRAGHFMHSHDDGDTDGVQKSAGVVFVRGHAAKKEVLVLDVRDVCVFHVHLRAERGVPSFFMPEGTNGLHSTQVWRVIGWDYDPHVDFVLQPTQGVYQQIAIIADTALLSVRA